MPLTDHAAPKKTVKRSVNADKILSDVNDSERVSMNQNVKPTPVKSKVGGLLPGLVGFFEVN